VSSAKDANVTSRLSTCDYYTVQRKLAKLARQRATGQAVIDLACVKTGVDRGQTTLFPECLEDWIDEGNPVRAIDAFVEKLQSMLLLADEVIE